MTLQGIVNVTLELALGATAAEDPESWVWTDVTEYLRNESAYAATISQGRQDELSTAPPASMSLKLDNRDDRFTIRNPMSPYYGQFGRGTPIRLWAEGGIRFSGYITEATPNWEAAKRNKFVDVQAGGVSRRLELSDAGTSALRNYIPTTNPIAYWPLEDKPGSTEARSALENEPPMVQNYFVSENNQRAYPAFGGNEGSGGSAPLPNFPPAFVGLEGEIPPFEGNDWTAAVMFLGDTSQSDMYPLTVYVDDQNSQDVGEYRTQVYTYDNAPSQVYMQAIANDTTSVRQVIANVTQDGRSGPFDGRWHVVFIGRRPGTVNPEMFIYYHGSLGTQWLDAHFTPLRIAALDYRARTPDSDTRGVGHVCFWDRALTVEEMQQWQNVMEGLPGESAVDRMVRTCDIEGIPLTVAEGVEDSEPMGAQPYDKLISILRDCERVDGGILSERDGTLHYTARSKMYENADGPAKLTLSQSEMGLEFEPITDDQYYFNDLTVNREDGNSARVVDEQQVSIFGRVDTSEEYNLASDERTKDYATWLLRQGTSDEIRYPQVSFNLVKSPELIPDWIATELGDKIVLSEPLPGMTPDPVEMFLEGYTETIGTRHWAVTMNTTPTYRYRLGTIGDPDTGRLDTAGSTLTKAVGETDSTLQVITNDGPIWIDDFSHPTEFPFDINVNGERMTVNSIVSSEMDDFERESVDSWGVSPSGRQWSVTGAVASDFYVSGGVAVHSHSTNGSRHFSVLEGSERDTEIVANVSMPVKPQGGTVAASMVVRYGDNSNYYMLQAPFLRDSGIHLELYKCVSGSFTKLSSQNLIFPSYEAGEKFRIRLQVLDTVVRGKIWKATENEPPQWQVNAFDSSFTAGQVAIQSVAFGEPAANQPFVVEFDDFEVIGVQDMAVTRSVNGVVKSHPAGSNVNLWSPLISAL